MRKNHRPFWLYRAHAFFQRCFIRQFIRPQFEQVGTGLRVFEAQSLQLFGHGIHAGRHLHIISNKTKPVQLSTWSSKQGQGRLVIGDYVLLSPGVQISSADNIQIGNNCMIAAECYISDSDWHGVYNRTRPFRCHAPIILKDNVWLGFRSIINKGVTIGENSIVAAGSVVTTDVPDNTIVGGNPAKIIRHINPDRRMLTREYLFSQLKNYDDNQDALSEFLMANNSTLTWLRTLVAPSRDD